MSDIDRIQQEIELLHRKVAQLYQAGQWEPALAVGQEALHLAQTHLGPEHSEAATSLNNLGSLLQAQGELACPERSK
jgi:hypothetical protein